MSNAESPNAESPSIYVDLPRGNFIEIRMKAKVTKKEFEGIKRIFEMAEIAFVADEVADAGIPLATSPPFPDNAVVR